MNALLPQAVDQTYEDVRALIYDTIYKFMKQHGGDFDELLSRAHWQFVLAYNSYNPQKASFVTWVRTMVWFGMLETIRQKQHRQRLYEKIKLITEFKPTYYEPTLEKMAMLSDSGKELLQLILDTQNDFQLIIPQSKQEAYQARVLLRVYLRRIGWTGARIAETFGEIAKALSD